MREVALLTLTTVELRELTGSAKLPAQRRWLVEHGLPFRESGLRLLVSRAAAEKWLSGVDALPGRGVNLAAVR
jgi:Domain of unknown function (DUF4224)